MTQSIPSISGLDNYLVEGIVEQDPMTGRLTIRTVDSTGAAVTFDPSQALARYVGQEVRMIITPFETIRQIESLVKEDETTQLVDPSSDEGVNA